MSRRRKNQSLIDVLMELPWQVSVVFGVVVFVGLRWILPAIWSSNVYLKSAATTLASMAWLFSGLFLLVGAIRFATIKLAAARQGTVRKQTAASGRPSVADWREPTYAPQTRNGSDPLGALYGEIRAEQAAAVPQKPTEWSLELIRDIEWKRFEDLCQKFYEAKGIRSETTPLGADGGVDIRLYQDDNGKATTIVQCKSWGERFVGVKLVRELLGVMTHEKIAKGFFMTSSRFSDDAKEFAQGNSITLIDGPMLLMMIKRLPAESQTGLLRFATEGDYMTPTCPSCGIKMKRIPGKETRPDFWGCSNYPRCRQKLGIRH